MAHLVKMICRILVVFIQCRAQGQCELVLYLRQTILWFEVCAVTLLG